MKKNTFIIVLIFLCGTLRVWGQSVSGKVVDDKDLSGLADVSIRVFTADSVYFAGTITDGNGKFRGKAPTSDFYLIASCVGRFDQKIVVQNQNSKMEVILGDIIMRENVNPLGEVLVTASPIIAEVNKLITYPTSQQVKASTSGIDLLKNLYLPGLFVDPVQQKISIDGTSGVVYQINGIKSSLEQIVALKADHIQRVEYAQTPSIRELSSNSGVINVILKKEHTGTFIFANSQGALTTGFINGTAGFKTIFNNSVLSLNYNFNWRDYSKRWQSESETYYYPTDTLTLSKKGQYAPFGYLSQNINLAYVYNDSKHTFSAQLINSIYSAHDRNYLDMYQGHSNQIPVFRDIYAKNKNYTPSLDIYYIRKFKEQQVLETNIVATYMHSDYNRALVDNYPDHVYNVNNNIDGNKKSIILDGLYYDKIGGIKYSVGITGSYSDTKSKYGAENNRLRRTDIYPYMSLEGKILNVSYSIGSGMKMMFTDDTNRNTKYYRNLSTISLFYKSNDIWSLRYTLRYMPSYPSLSDLNNVDQRQDSIMIVRGNPLLKPSLNLRNQLTFMYSLKKNLRITTNVNTSKTFDPMRDAFFYDSDVSSFVSRIKNQKYDQQFGGDINVYASSIFKIFSISAGGAWNNYNTKGEGYSHSLNNLSWYIFSAAQINDFTINCGYRKPSRQLFGEIEMLNENYSSIGATYKKKAFSVNAGLYYPFSSGTKYVARRRSNVAPSIRNVYVKDNANMFYIGFSYNISWGKSIFNVNKRLNNSDYDRGIQRINDN